MRGRTAVMMGLVVLVLSASAAGALGAAPSAPGLLPPPPGVPAELIALEAKAEALQIASIQVRLRTSLNGGGKLKGLDKLLSFSVEGLETVTPPAAAIKVVLFGASLRLRIVGTHRYLFSWALGRRDGGRPWVLLGKGSFGKLLGGIGGSSPGTGASGAKRFSGLLTALNEGSHVRALGPSTIDSQPVMGFEADLPDTSPAAGEVGSLGGFSASRRAKAKPKRKPKPKPKVVMTLRIYFAAAGLPVRTVLTSDVERISFSVDVDLPAINFADTIPAPPASHVITEAGLKKLNHHASRKRSVTTQSK